MFWGLENNCTRSLSAYNVVHVTLIKGFFTAVASAAIALLLSIVGVALTSVDVSKLDASEVAAKPQ